MLNKLHKYGVRGITLDWFRRYLLNKKQYVKIGDGEPQPLNIICGIPQGCTLGPLLFLLYINDLPNSSTKLSFRLFADDANIFYTSKNFNEIETIMNTESQNIHNYCSANKLSLNMKKTHFMLIRSSRKSIISNMKILNIEQKNCIKYLGIYLDQHLIWKHQITHIKNEISKNLGIFYKLRNYQNIHMLKQLYYIHLFSHI